jgi:predicted phage tail component-like protein
MIYGLTFNGKHSYRDFGLVMQSKNRPILPEPKIVTDEAACMDGEYDYSTVNPDNEVKYKSRTLEITFNFDRGKINCRNPFLIKQQARKIAAWLACGEAALIFDDELDKQELAKVVNKLDLESQVESGRPFTINFKCKPFSLLCETVEEIGLDTDIPLDSDYRLDESYIFNVSGNTSIEVNNFGTRNVKPVIEVMGTFTTLSITANGKIITYSESIASETITIDCEKLQTKKGILSKGQVVTGEYLTLITGLNAVQVSGSGLNCTITFKFRPLYF